MCELGCAVDRIQRPFFYEALSGSRGNVIRLLGCNLYAEPEAVSWRRTLHYSTASVSDFMIVVTEPWRTMEPKIRFARIRVIVCVWGPMRPPFLPPRPSSSFVYFPQQLLGFAHAFARGQSKTHNRPNALPCLSNCFLYAMPDGHQQRGQLAHSIPAKLLSVLCERRFDCLPVARPQRLVERSLAHQL